MTISRVKFLLIGVVASFFIVDQFNPYLMRECSDSKFIKTPAQAKEFVLHYWRSNPELANYGSPRFPNLEALLSGAETDGKWEIKRYWSFLYLIRTWRAGFFIYKYQPEYYDVFVIFTHCGGIMGHEKV